MTPCPRQNVFIKDSTTALTISGKCMKKMYPSQYKSDTKLDLLK